MKKIYKYVGLAIIALMFLSSIVAISLQSYIYFPQQNQQQTQLPNTNIINYDLSPAQKTVLFQQYKTLMIFQYPSNCNNCSQIQSLVESFVTNSQFSSQLFLEELSGTQSPPSLSILSNYGQDTLTNITQDMITQDLCKIVSQPPTFCALQQVK